MRTLKDEFLLNLDRQHEDTLIIHGVPEQEDESENALQKKVDCIVAPILEIPATCVEAHRVGKIGPKPRIVKVRWENQKTAVIFWKCTKNIQKGYTSTRTGLSCWGKSRGRSERRQRNFGKTTLYTSIRIWASLTMENFITTLNSRKKWLLDKYSHSQFIYTDYLWHITLNCLYIYIQKKKKKKLLTIYRYRYYYHLFQLIILKTMKLWKIYEKIRKIIFTKPLYIPNCILIWRRQPLYLLRKIPHFLCYFLLEKTWIHTIFVQYLTF